MFWHMTGLSTASPVEAILDKENFTLEELLDEDEIIQECKALNGRLINFLREKDQVEQLVKYIVEEAPEDAVKQRTFKFPFVACEIFTCDVDVILKALVEDEELMDLLFSFLDADRPHTTRLAGYFSKVVVCLLLRKTTPLMNHIRAHQDIINKLVDLIGITSIMEVLIRLIGIDEHIYANDVDSLQWLEDINVLDMILEKFSLSDCPEVHANAAEILCTITRYSPPGIASKISSPSFIGKLFHHALQESRPKSVLVNILSVCICLLDPKRLSPGVSYMYGRQMSHDSGVTVDPQTVQGMLESLGDLLKFLDPSPEDNVMLTTYGKLQPPLGKDRLKIVEFFAVFIGASNDVAQKELIRLDVVNRILKLFFGYPYNNFLHHHAEHIVISCLESKNSQLVDHLLHDCNLVEKILEAEKNSFLAVEASKPTVPVEGRDPPRVGNIGHLTRIANKLVQLGNSDSSIQEFLQGNSEWMDWQTNVLLKRNVVENVFQWACGRPTTLQDRTRDSDDDDYQDRDFDVAALANNLSQAFRYGIYNNNDMDEPQGSLERNDEDMYFDDESAEVVISSLRLGDDNSGSLFTNSNWFAFEDSNLSNKNQSSPSLEAIEEGDDAELADTGASDIPNLDMKPALHGDAPSTKDLGEPDDVPSDNPVELVEWRENFDSVELIPASESSASENTDENPSMQNGDRTKESVVTQPNHSGADETNGSSPSSAADLHVETSGGESADSKETTDDATAESPKTVAVDEGNQSKLDSPDGTTDLSGDKN